jgi:SAM-dependent methyltransferase
MRSSIRHSLIPASLAVLAFALHAQDTIQINAPFLPTPPETVRAMLQLAKVTSNDVVYDLGSGDGRVVITAAALYKTRAVGIEIKPELVKIAQASADSEGVGDLVTFRQQDIFDADLSKATVVTLYLLPEQNLKLKAKLLKELPPGARVVSFDFDMGSWRPDKEVTIESGHHLYMWEIRKND